MLRCLYSCLDSYALKTTRTCSGDVWDWLDAASVPGSEIDPPPVPDIELPSDVELQLTELDGQPELRGPSGSVPMLRPGFGPYVFGEVPADSVEDFVARSVVSVPGQPDGQDRLYAGIYKVTPAIQVQSYINAYEGKVEPKIMSVLEMAVACQGPDPDTTLELVGVAASRDMRNFDSDKSGPAKTRLQVEFLTAGSSATGDNKGGWHTARLKGFIPARGAPYGPGVVLNDPKIGRQEGLYEIHNLTGNWWILHNGHWLGHYPAELFDMMTFEACEVYYYGEVYDGTPTSWTSSDMGSGLFAAQGWGKAAHFRKPRYVDTAGMYQWPDGAKEATPIDTLCYTSSGLINEATIADRIIYTSGPGGDSPGCN